MRKGGGGLIAAANRVCVCPKVARFTRPASEDIPSERIDDIALLVVETARIPIEAKADGFNAGKLSKLQHVGLAEALELCLLLRDTAPERYPRAALRWHGRLCREVDVSLEEAQAILAALVVMAGARKGNAAYALAELLSRRGLERPCETLVAWAREA